MTETVTDLFCGAGGSGQGAAHVPGLELRMAANHAVTPPAAEFLLRAVVAFLTTTTTTSEPDVYGRGSRT